MPDKYQKLQEILGKYPSAIVAFSGGVDSTFLAKAASGTIKKLLLVTAASSTYPKSELDESRKLAQIIGAEQRIIVSEELDIDGFAENPPDRCYYCKHELFSKIVAIAAREGYQVVLDGSNMDDLSDYRPGRRALSELGIVSPLVEAGLSKPEIRQISLELGLPTASKPAFACLASRFPYGESITKSKLDRVGSAEEEIRKAGFRMLRVRSHDNLARIEVGPDEMERAWTQRQMLGEICKKAGFVYVALDIFGYRTGAMNEAL